MPPSEKTTTRDDASSSKSKTNRASCLECRARKIKCHPPPSHDGPSGSNTDPRCSRCIRLQKDCQFVKHHRGRQPEKQRWDRLEQQIEHLSQALAVQQGSSPSFGSSSMRSGASEGSPASVGPSLMATQGSQAPWMSPPSYAREASPGDVAAGGPSFSNPLKLLSEAAVRSDEQTTIPLSIPEEEEEGNASQSYTSSRTDSRVSTFYTPKYDVGESVDPVSAGLLGLHQAEELMNVFMLKINSFITVLDPELHTLGVVRARSALLASVVCSIAARLSGTDSMTPGVKLSTLLEDHIENAALPHVLRGGYRSVEISQALLLMAAYHPAVAPLHEDRSFALSGHAIRIAMELNVHAQIRSVRVSPHDVALNREMRNQERCWYNLWMYDHSICLHTGRRFTLANDPVAADCDLWAASPSATQNDQGIVSSIQLRTIMIDLADAFQSRASTDWNSPSSAQRRLGAFMQDVHLRLDRWRRHWEPHFRSSSSYRLAKGDLYLSYASLLLYSLPLKHSTLLQNIDLQDCRRAAHRSASDYMLSFLDSFGGSDLVFAHNSAYVTLGYAALMALKLSQQNDDLASEAASTCGLVDSVASALGTVASISAATNGPIKHHAQVLQELCQHAVRSYSTSHTGGRPPPDRTGRSIASFDPERAPEQFGDAGEATEGHNLSAGQRDGGSDGYDLWLRNGFGNFLDDDIFAASRDYNNPTSISPHMLGLEDQDGFSRMFPGILPREAEESVAQHMG